MTVAVVSWNTRELLSACLVSLEPDAASGLAAIWVVDNASSDGSADLVQERFPWVSLIASRENLGFGAAVNLVAARTSSAWLAPANADTSVTPGAIQRLMLEGERHPEAGLIAPRLILPSGETQHSVYPFPTIPFTLAYVLGLPHVSGRLARHWCIDGGFQAHRRREVPWAVGAFLLVRRRAWDEVGGFNRDQWMYAEDLDLGWRLRRTGWTARFEPSAVINHVESAATTKAWAEQRQLRWHVSTYAWLVQRRGLTMARLIATINVLGFSMRWVLHSGRALLGSRSARRARVLDRQAARAHVVGLRPRTYLERVR